MRARLATWAQALGPVRAAFIGSLLLSFVAVQGHLVNRDGIYYLETARTMLESGLVAGWQAGEWAFLPTLIAALAFVMKVSPETAAIVLNALFMAGTCALLVSITRRRLPEAAWLACLVVLAMPAYNQYRNEVLREYGFWFFSMLAFWLAMRWAESPRWREAIACQLALACAALFRLEAVAFYPALILWQAFTARDGRRQKRVLMIGCLSLAGTALAMLLFGSGLLATPSRLTYYLKAANPLHGLEILQEAANRMSDLIFQYKYSREEAGYVLFFGLLTIIPMKFIKMTGIFLVPLAYQFALQPARQLFSRWQPLPWAFLAYVLVLVAFVTNQFFLVGRYVSLLNLLVVPLAAGGLALLMERFPRWKALMLVLALLTMAANVVSLSPRKTHIVEAGAWLAANVADHGQVCLSNARLAYYAGWRSSGIVFENPELEIRVTGEHCNWLAMETRKKGDIDAWLQKNRLKEIKRFENASGDAVIIARPEGRLQLPAAQSR
ncbi:MAG: glycosyltransferase family 39 protein [Rhodocyclaceae bacterium]|nr:glycosyltransferase family 39 protein [Rhodocyclaceae bacterium]